MATMEAATTRRGPGLPLRALRFLGGQLVTVWAALALGYLFLPIAVMVLFSFNHIEGRFNFVWNGFSLDAWRHPFAVAGLSDAMILSLEIAAISTIIATALGTLIALALIRYRFFGFSATNLLVLIPLTTPEIVLGASLLTLFLQLGMQTGFMTIVIAHVMFNISYVVVTVKARLRGFDWTLEEAAMDLGANEFQTFRKVTLPLIFPGILAAALLAFALSLDDFIITLFNSGQEVTFPLFVWGAARVAVPPQINVMGTMIMGSTVVLMVLSLLLQRRRA
ncbi:MAG TPA: ABC transporter permease [Dehalococcoidia bacterium]|nr:ABC transporter permease [Dehalococcoidia bacterium]